MTIDEQLQRLTNIVDSLASSVVAHDNQIEALIQVAETQRGETEELKQSVFELTRQWQAYINTLRRQ